MCKEYVRGFKLLFTNCAAVLILIGCSLRLWETGIIGFYQQKYFKVYEADYTLYSYLVAIGSFVGGILANLVAGIIVDYFEKKSEMTIPLICTIKAILDIPFCIMTYF